MKKTSSPNLSRESINWEIHIVAGWVVLVGGYSEILYKRRYIENKLRGVAAHWGYGEIQDTDI